MVSMLMLLLVVYMMSTVVEQLQAEHLRVALWAALARPQKCCR